VTQTTVTDPVAFVAAQAGSYLVEAERLRKIVMPAAGAGPRDYRDRLLEARASLDRMEEILLQVYRMRGGMLRKAADCEHAAEDRWNALAAQAAQTGQGARDYEGAKERYARWSVQCFDLTRAARQWTRAADLAVETAEQLRTMHFGLRDVRAELIEHLRAFVLESNLDR
jgi:hypothetical protein